MMKYVGGTPIQKAIVGIGVTMSMYWALGSNSPNDNVNKLIYSMAISNNTNNILNNYPLDILPILYLLLGCSIFFYLFN